VSLQKQANLPNHEVSHQVAASCCIVMTNHSIALRAAQNFLPIYLQKFSRIF
jgi:hypothetical protein